MLLFWFLFQEKPKRLLTFTAMRHKTILEMTYGLLAVNCSVMLIDRDVFIRLNSKMTPFSFPRLDDFDESRARFDK